MTDQKQTDEEKQAALKDKLKRMGVMQDDHAPPAKSKPSIYNWAVLIIFFGLIALWYWYESNLADQPTAVAQNGSGQSGISQSGDEFTPADRSGPGPRAGYPPGYNPPGTQSSPVQAQQGNDASGFDQTGAPPPGYFMPPPPRNMMYPPGYYPPGPPDGSAQMQQQPNGSESGAELADPRIPPYNDLPQPMDRWRGPPPGYMPPPGYPPRGYYGQGYYPPPPGPAYPPGYWGYPPPYPY